MKQIEAQIKSLFTEPSIADCSKSMNENKNLLSAKMPAGQIVLDGNEIVQVQVIVTREKDEQTGEFLEPFTMVETEQY